MKLYHCTPVENIDAILAEGLIGQGTIAYGKRGREPEYDEPPTVHLASEPADDFVSSLYGDVEVAILEVDVDGLDVQPGWDGEGSFAVLGNIEASRVTRVGTYAPA